jgi:hypothetical protein
VGTYSQEAPRHEMSDLTLGQWLNDNCPNDQISNTCGNFA